MARKRHVKKNKSTKQPGTYALPIRVSRQCPVDLLQMDLNNPRLQTGTDLAVKNEAELIAVLADIAALDELVTSDMHEHIYESRAVDRHR